MHHFSPPSGRESISRPPGQSVDRRGGVMFLSLGLVALIGAGYNLGSIVKQPTGLVVSGAAHVEKNHEDRKQPLEVAFRLRNPTRHPIRIRQVKSNCGCTAASLSGEVVGPGAETVVLLRVLSFDSYAHRFAERTTVETTDGQIIELWVSGHLPEVVDKVRSFPPSLFVERGRDGQWPERSLRLRVPRACSYPPAQVTVQPIGLAPGSWNILEVDASQSHRELLVVGVPSPDPASMPTGSRLRLEAGCDAIEIPVRFSGSL